MASQAAEPLRLAPVPEVQGYLTYKEIYPPGTLL